MGPSAAAGDRDTTTVIASAAAVRTAASLSKNIPWSSDAPDAGSPAAISAAPRRTAVVSPAGPVGRPGINRPCVLRTAQVVPSEPAGHLFAEELPVIGPGRLHHGHTGLCRDAAQCFR